MLGDILAAVAFRLVRAMILAVPDPVLAVGFRAVRWLAYLVTADLQLRVAISDVIGIFQDGPPGTDTVRKMMREADLALARDVVRGLVGL